MRGWGRVRDERGEVKRERDERRVKIAEEGKRVIRDGWSEKATRCGYTRVVTPHSDSKNKNHSKVRIVQK